MKRRILSFFLTICLVGSLLSICSVNTAASEPVLDVTIANRIDELYHLLNGKYFNTNQDFSCGAKAPPYNHGCEKCDTTQIVKAQWFKDMFGTVNSSQFVSSGKSCVGFAWFAEWYIFRANDSDTVRRDKILKGGRF